MSYTLTFTLTEDSVPVEGADIEIVVSPGGETLSSGVTNSDGVFVSDPLTAPLVDLITDYLAIVGLGDLDGDEVSLDFSGSAIVTIPDAPPSYGGTFVIPPDNNPFEPELDSLLMTFELMWKGLYQIWIMQWEAFIDKYNDEDATALQHLALTPENPPIFPATTLTGYSDLAEEYANDLSEWKVGYLNFQSGVNAFLSAYNAYFNGTESGGGSEGGSGGGTIVPANFPETVWTGSSATRATPALVERSADYNDWNQMTAEVVAIQQELTVLGGTNFSTVANANVVGGVPVVHRINIADSAGDTDVILTHKTRVTDIRVVKTTGAGDSGDAVTIKNGTTAISDAISLEVADKAVVKAATIDDAQHEIAAEGTLRVTATKATNCACVVYVSGYKVA